LPPIAIQVGTEAFLLDDSQRYAQQAASRKGVVALDIFEGMHHVFQRDVGSLETAAHALDISAKFVVAHWR
jgi:epsilon-lactone hydrolase